MPSQRSGRRGRRFKSYHPDQLDIPDQALKSNALGPALRTPPDKCDLSAFLRQIAGACAPGALGDDSAVPITHEDLCIATKAAQPFERDGRVFELKYDGFRILASRRGALASLLSRKGTDFTAQFPEIAVG